MNNEIDAQAVIHQLAQQIADQAVQIAVLRAQLSEGVQEDEAA